MSFLSWSKLERWYCLLLQFSKEFSFWSLLSRSVLNLHHTSHHHIATPGDFEWVPSLPHSNQWSSCWPLVTTLPESRRRNYFVSPCPTNQPVSNLIVLRYKWGMGKKLNHLTNSSRSTASHRVLPTNVNQHPVKELLWTSSSTGPHGFTINLLCKNDTSLCVTNDKKQPP